MVTPEVLTDPGAALVEAPVLGVVEVEQSTEVPASSGQPSGVAEAAPAAVQALERPLGDEVASLRRQLAQFQAERQAQEVEAAASQEVAQLQQEAVARGMTDEDIRWLAQRHHTLARRVAQERQQLREEQDYLQGKQNAAAQFGKQYGVDPALLMTAANPQDMVVIAEREKRYAAQEVRLKALEMKQVPPQALNNAGSSRAGSVALTMDNIDKLYMDHEIQRPGTPNPYEVQYRKFLNGS